MIQICPYLGLNCSLYKSIMYCCFLCAHFFFHLTSMNGLLETKCFVKRKSYHHNLVKLHIFLHVSDTNAERMFYRKYDPHFHNCM